MTIWAELNTTSEARAAVQGAMYSAAGARAFTDKEASNTAELIDVIASANRWMSVDDIISSCNNNVGPNGIDAEHWQTVRAELGDYGYVAPHYGRKDGFEDINTPREAVATLQGSAYTAAGDLFTDDEVRNVADVSQAIKSQGGVSVRDQMDEAKLHTGYGRIDAKHLAKIIGVLKDRGELPRWYSKY